MNVVPMQPGERRTTRKPAHPLRSGKLLSVKQTARLRLIAAMDRERLIAVIVKQMQQQSCGRV